MSLRNTVDMEPWEVYEHLAERGAIWDDQMGGLLVVDPIHVRQLA
jgi:hypothetical protein